jgi:hypothetical protein
MKKVLPIGLLLGLPLLAYAQEAAVVTEEGAAFTLTSTHFFVALIAGIVLAAAFQLVLTNLSLAAGLNVAGAATKPDRRRKTKAEKAKEERERRDKDESAMDEAHETARKVGAGFGIWALITSSISLFFAAWIAVTLSRTGNSVVGGLLGLVIWGLFYVLMISLETSAVTSLVGSLIHTAKSGLRSAYEATTSIFGRSEKKQAADTATEMAKAVREELLGGETLKTQLRDYFGRLEHAFSPNRIRKELEKVLDDTEIEYLYREGEGGVLDEDRLVANIHSGGGLKPEQAKTALSSIKGAIQKMREEAASGKDRPTAMATAAMRATGMSSEKAEETVRRVEDYLRSTGKEDLNPDAIKRDLERLVRDPRGGMESLRGRLSHIDRQTVASILSQRTDMSQEDANRVVDTVVSTIQSLTGRAEGQTGGIGEAVRGKAEDVKERINAKVRDYLNSLGRPELQYEDVKEDLTTLFDNPKEGAEALLNRLKSLDRDSVKAILASNRNISEEDAERIVSRVEEARDAVVEKADQVKREVERRVRQAKEEAVHQADEVRKTAATAAWWAFFAAVVSGFAAVLGGTMPFWT